MFTMKRGAGEELEAATPFLQHSLHTLTAPACDVRTPEAVDRMVVDEGNAKDTVR